MKKIPVSIYRGGTSRAIFFHKKDLPASINEQDEIIIKAIGSGHSLQVNGLGGGNPLTSKCAIIGPPSVPQADVNYTFVYPGVSLELEVTIVQAGNLAVFCSMAALGIKGDPAGWEKDSELWQKMEAVRGAAAVRLGMAETLEESRLKTPAVPKVLAVRKPQPYKDLSGRPHAEESHDFMVLTVAMGVMHRSIAVTGSVATAAAAVLPGSVVYDLRHGKGSEVIIGHSSGPIALTAELDEKNGKWQARKIALNRTAREIMKGFVFIDD